jgi:hypothetical protein
LLAEVKKLAPAIAGCGIAKGAFVAKVKTMVAAQR